MCIQYSVYVNWVIEMSEISESSELTMVRADWELPAGYQKFFFIIIFLLLQKFL